MGTSAEGAEPERPETRVGPGIRVTRAVNEKLRAMRAANPQAARSVDNVISYLNLEATGEPVRLDIPGAPPDPEYRALVPARHDAPVVIYRPLRPEDGVDGRWLVTALINRDTYVAYRQAERQGILENPAVRQITEQIGGTIARTAPTTANADETDTPPGGSAG